MSRTPDNKEPQTLNALAEEIIEKDRLSRRYAQIRNILETVIEGRDQYTVEGELTLKQRKKSPIKMTVRLEREANPSLGVGDSEIHVKILAPVNDVRDTFFDLTLPAKVRGIERLRDFNEDKLLRGILKKIEQHQITFT